MQSCVTCSSPLSKGIPALSLGRMDEASTSERIVFFDGVCGLCNRFVDRLLRADRKRLFRFAPLQGSTAQGSLPAGMAEAMESIVYLRDGRILQRSDAVLRIVLDLGGWRKVYGLSFMFPRGLRDRIYAWVARNRYRWFGKRETCRLPTAEERARFLP